MSNRVSDTQAHLVPAAAKWRRTPLGLNYLLWGALVAANAIDVLASRYAFSLGVSELNPLVARLLDAYGVVGLSAVKAVLLAALLVLLPRVTGKLQVLLVFTCIVYAAVVAYHLLSLTTLGLTGP